MKKNIVSLLAFISGSVPALAYANENTAADAADKALTMLGDATSKITDLFQKTAPEVWRIMIRQQYTEAVTDTLLSGLFFLISIGVFYYTKDSLKNKTLNNSLDDSVDNDWRMVGKFLIFAAILITAIIFICCISEGIGRLINPEFYAIKSMLELAKPSK